MKKFNEEMIRGAQNAAKVYAEEINSLKPVNFSGIQDKAALIIVDMINGFINQGAMSSERIKDVIGANVRVLQAFKAGNMPVAAFADCHEKGCAEFSAYPEHCLDGDIESEVIDELKDIGGNYYRLIRKNSTNGFIEKGFEDFLNDKNLTCIDTFVITGCCTDICVLQFALCLKTYGNMTNKAFRIIIPADCVETYDAPWHQADFTNIAAYKLLKDAGAEFVSEIIYE